MYASHMFNEDLSVSIYLSLSNYQSVKSIMSGGRNTVWAYEFQVVSVGENQK